MAYQAQAVDGTEPVSDTSWEISANLAHYGVVSGCATTADTGDLTVDDAGGVILHNGIPVVVSSATDGWTLVSDPSNPRFTWLAYDSDGTRTVVSGDASADPVIPEIGDRVANRLVYIPANESLASNCTLIDKRIPTVQKVGLGPVVPTHAGAVATTTLQNNSNTNMRVGLVYIPEPTVVGKIRFNVTAVGTAGTLGLALFSQDGQTRYFNETTSSISGTGVQTHTLGTPVGIPQGYAYIALNPDSTADITTTMWTTNPAIAAAASSGDYEISGDVTVTAGTIPTAFDPDTDVSYGTSRAIVVRFD